jgi:hypothetical protein
MAWTDLNYQSVFTDNLAAAHENGGIDHRQSSAILGRRGGVLVREPDSRSEAST